MKSLIILLTVGVVAVFGQGPFGPLNGKVVGGTETTIASYPFVASVQAPGHRGRRHFCAGTIISNEWVVTAAHCLKTFDDLHAFQVRVGATQHNNAADAQDLGVSEIHVHPRYISGLVGDKNYEYDVALLKLSTPIVFTDTIKEIELASSDASDSLGDGTLGVVVGWTELSANNATATLHKIDFKVIGTVDCNTKHTITITDNMICAELKTERSDICQGDAGSPFIVNNKLFGITVSGVSCETANSPAILTKVSAIVEWINEKTSLFQLFQ